MDRDSVSCSLCLGLLHEPISLFCCGNSFCRRCLAAAVRQQPSCPLCRKPCYANLRDAKPSIILTQLIQRHFPAECAERAVAAAEEARSSERLGLFILGSPTRVRGDALPLPGAPVAFTFFEPRYLLLGERAAENGLFGLQVTAEAPMGVAVSVRSVTPMAGGRLQVEGRCSHRYRVLAPPEQTPGEFGLYTALVEAVEDEPLLPRVAPSGTAAAAAAAAVGDAAAVDPATAAAPDAALRPPAVLDGTGLSPRAIAVLRRYASSDAQRASLLRSAVADILLRLLGGLSPAAVHRLTMLHGHPPPSTPAPAAASASASTATAGLFESVMAWSFYAADTLALSAAARAQCFATRSPLHRLALVYAFLEQTAEEIGAAQRASADRQVHGGAAGSAEPAETAVAANSTGSDALERRSGGAASEEPSHSSAGSSATSSASASSSSRAPDALPSSLDPLLILQPTNATRVFAALGANAFPALQLGRGFTAIAEALRNPAEAGSRLLRHPLVSSLLVFSTVLTLLILLRGGLELQPLGRRM